MLQQHSKPCGGNSFIFSAILLCIFATVVWLLILMFQANSTAELLQRSAATKSERFSALTPSKKARHEKITSMSLQPSDLISRLNTEPNNDFINSTPELPISPSDEFNNENTMDNQIRLLQNKLSTQQQEITQLTLENNQLKSSLHEVKATNKQQLPSINEALQTEHKAKTKLASIQQELSGAKLALSLKQQELNSVLNNLQETTQLSGQHIIEIENREKELASLKKQLSNTDIQISDLKNRFTVFEMKQEILFNKAEARLNKNGRRAISTLAKIFRQFPDRQIAIQGHTDNQTVGKRLQQKFTTNWELAAARSASAIHYLQQVEKINPERMILVSYAQYRPIRSNASAKGQANNRRIEVILMPKDFDFFRETTD